MSKTYFLSQNNKESDPYTEEERDPASAPNRGLYAAGLPDKTPKSKQGHTGSARIIQLTALPALQSNAFAREESEYKLQPVDESTQAQAPQSEELKEGLQVKYARSLEDLKQEYAEWQHQKTTKRSIGLNKKVLAIVASTIIIGAVFFVAWPAIRGQNIKDQQAELSDNSIKDIATQPAVLNKDNETANAATQQVINTTPLTHTKELSVDEFIDSIQKAMEGYQVQLQVATASPKRKKRRRQPGESITILENASVQQPEIKKANLKNLVVLNTRSLHKENKETLTGLELILQNNSDELLQKVSVTVSYYTKNNQFFDKETLYFKNVSPRSSLTLSIPGNQKAAFAHFKLGTIEIAEN